MMSLHSNKTLVGPWSWYNDFCGIRMAHNYYTYHLINKLLSENNVEQIIELGTGQGALSIYLGLEGVRRNIRVYTYDIRSVLGPSTERLFDKLEIKFKCGDVFVDLFEEIKDLLASKITCLVCDDGDKRKEFATFVPLIKKGSVAAVHDYGQEISKPDIEKLNGIELLYEEEWLKHNVQLAMVRKI